MFTNDEMATVLIYTRFPNDPTEAAFTETARRLFGPNRKIRYVNPRFFDERGFDGAGVVFVQDQYTKIIETYQALGVTVNPSGDMKTTSIASEPNPIISKRRRQR